MLNLLVKHLNATFTYIYYYFTYVLRLNQEQNLIFIGVFKLVDKPADDQNNWNSLRLEKYLSFIITF